MNYQNVEGKAKPTRHSQIPWGAISWNNRTALMGDPEAKRNGVNGGVIRSMYEETLPTILELGMVFVEDNAPTHTARIVQDWLA